MTTEDGAVTDIVHGRSAILLDTRAFHENVDTLITEPPPLPH
ncbi:hypothetical protein J2Z50_004674 [Ensifer mexicanus]|nr:hypothetical protein [Sinorhizobium mexicanum]